MKLWYQSLARQTESTPYGKLLRATIADAADPGTTVDMRGVAQPAGIGVHYKLLEHHDVREVIYNAMQAEREGYDAFFRGKELPDNPYPLGSAWAKSWEKGNWQAFDEWKQRQESIVSNR